jgi:hypothetical protein
VVLPSGTSDSSRFCNSFRLAGVKVGGRMRLAAAWGAVAGVQIPVLNDEPNTVGEPEDGSISARNTMLAPEEMVG